jgi:hypothetical protein
VGARLWLVADPAALGDQSTTTPEMGSSTNEKLYLDAPFALPQWLYAIYRLSRGSYQKRAIRVSASHELEHAARSEPRMRKMQPRSGVICFSAARRAAFAQGLLSGTHLFFDGGGSISAILRRQSASEACGPETNVPLTFVLYQPDTIPSRSDSSDLT